MDSAGRVIGVNTAKHVASQILRFGKVRRGSIGNHGQTVAVHRRLERHFQLPLSTAVLVAGVEPGSPAEKAGLQPGDLIVNVDGQPLGGVDALLRRLDHESAGREWHVSFLRDVRRMETRLTPVEALEA